MQKKRRGRPPKSEIAKHSPGGRKKVGRPKGEASILNEYKARMLASPKSEKVMQKVLDTALEDGHPHQGVCMKMVWDKVLPASYFEKDKLNGGRSAVEINLNFSESQKVQTVSTDEPIDVEFSDISGGADDSE